MHSWNTVAIVGVGLIGGSIGLALRKRKLARKVIGIGRRAESLKRALAAKAIHSSTTDLHAVADADIVVVCTPVDGIVEHVARCAQHCKAGAILTDAGSTKQHIVDSLDSKPLGEAHFVGSHPLAGSEKSGPEHARADLFTGRMVVVTPTRRTEKSAAHKITLFWKSLGANVVSMSPAAHDAAVAATSHAPHVIAAALAAATRSRDLPLVAGGWLDTTRVAGGDEELWRQILLDNRENTLAALESFLSTLAEFRTALELADGAKLKQLLRKGRSRRQEAT